MKRTIDEKTKLTAKSKSHSRLAGRLMWGVVLVWGVLFMLIRAAFRFSGNPALTFFLMFALFFVALFLVRFGVLRVQYWWQKARLALVRFLANRDDQSRRD